MEERKIASEDGMTFAYRDVREGEESPWKLNGKSIVPVAVPAPNDYQKTDLQHWTNGLTKEDLEFSIQYYYDRWNFAGDSCDEDKRIVDALTKERDERKKNGGNHGGCVYGGPSAYTESGPWPSLGPSLTLTAGNGGSGVGGTVNITSYAGSGMMNIGVSKK